MQRKVNQIGPSTLMVSLPSKWVKRYNVKKGDSLELFFDLQENAIFLLINGRDGVKGGTRDCGSLSPSSSLGPDPFMKKGDKNAK